MKISRLISWVAAVFVVIFSQVLWPSVTFAAVPTGDLAIIEFKMTGSESVVIENISSSSINLQNYVLEYFNKSSGINFNVPTDSQQLPDFMLQAQQSFLLSGDTVATCGAAGEANLGTSLSDTNGYLEVVKVSQSSGAITYTPQDHISWTSSVLSSGNSGLDLYSVPSATNDANAVWYRLLSDGTWHQYEINTTPCSLLVTLSSSSNTTYVQWASGEEAPATIVAASATNGIPSNDIGLAAPQITELLPNPSGTGNDDTDEFIEIYNPNVTAFDLSGFTLETGLTAKHDFTFAAGRSIEPGAFSAFYSSDTNLTLSNTSGQAWLLDPLGNIVSQSDAYGSAKDGQAWALAGGTWYWTSAPTPNAANLINGVASGGGSKTKTTPTTSSGSKTSGSSSPGNDFSDSSAKPPAPIHTWTLAAVGSAALLYAAYEYRADLANNIYRLRRYRAARAASGPGIIPASFSGTIGRLGRWQNHVRSRLGKRLGK